MLDAGDAAARGSFVPSIHFALSESNSGEAAAAYQHAIETDPGCMASFGTLAETALERMLVWRAIAKLGKESQGRITVRGVRGADLAACLERICRGRAAGRAVSDEQGAGLNRWAFELAGRLPPLSETARTLWGNGPDRRRGGTELIRRWRRGHAEIQNELLQGVGANKRYDPRPRAGRGAASAETRRALRPEERRWQALPTRIGEMARNAQEAVPVTLLDEATDALRLVTGLASGDDDEAAELMRRIERHCTDTLDAPALVQWLRRLRRECTAPPTVEPWLERWRRWQHHEPCGERTGAVAAAIVAGWSEPQAARCALDTRHEVRVVIARAREWRSQIEHWRGGLAALREAFPTGVGEEASSALERFVDALVDAGLTQRAVAEPDARRWLVGVRRQARAVEAARRRQRRRCGAAPSWTSPSVC